MSGMLASVCGEADRAIELLTESFPWWEQSGDAHGSAMARSFLGGVHVSQGRYDEAATLTLPAREYYEQAHARANDALGDSIQAVSAAGRALTLEQALAEAEAMLATGARFG
jgi:hypothetical protein